MRAKKKNPNSETPTRKGKAPHSNFAPEKKSKVVQSKASEGIIKNGNQSPKISNPRLGFDVSKLKQFLQNESSCRVNQVESEKCDYQHRSSVQSHVQIQHETTSKSSNEKTKKSSEENVDNLLDSQSSNKDSFPPLELKSKKAKKNKKQLCPVGETETATAGKKPKLKDKKVKSSSNNPKKSISKGRDEAKVSAQESGDDSLLYKHKLGKDGAALRDSMLQRLKSARFRYLNEQLYTMTGDNAAELFSNDPEAYKIYLEGFQTQVKKWPQNPVELCIEFIKKRPTAVVADLGCGDAKIAAKVRNKVHSFDLVAANKKVIACNMSNVPLDDGSVDIAVFCLSLMGTDLIDYVVEANRILCNGGQLLVAEVKSRIPKLGKFMLQLKKMGFQTVKINGKNKMFVFLQLRKTGPPPPEGRRPKMELNPCIYKKR